jgi:hypothetical protein
VVGVVLLVAAFSGDPSAGAEERKGGATKSFALAAGQPRPSVSERFSPTTDGFYHAHLLPRLAQQFEALRPYEGLPLRQSGPDAPFVFDEATRRARRLAGRGARRAVKSFLLDSVPVDRILERLESRTLGAERGPGRKVRPGLAVRHGVPVLELRRALGQGRLRTGFSLDGRLQLEYRGGRPEGTGIRAEYDLRREELDLACRFRF